MRNDSSVEAHMTRQYCCRTRCEKETGGARGIAAVLSACRNSNTGDTSSPLAWLVGGEDSACTQQTGDDRHQGGKDPTPTATQRASSP